MRKTLLIVLAVLLGGTGLFAAYVAWDYDPDNVSPTVEAPTYASIFDAAVRRRTGHPYDSLSEEARGTLLAQILTSGESDPVREMAILHCRDLADHAGALSMLRGSIPGLSPELFETAVTSILAVDPVGGRAYLDSLYRSLAATPASYTPLGGYRASSLLLTQRGANIETAFDERSRKDADFADGKASDMTLFFPEHPLYFVAMPNADDVLRRFDDSRFAQALHGTPVTEDVWGLPLLRTAAGLRTRLSDGMGFLSHFFSPEALFRDNLLIGKYGDDYLIVSFRDKNVGVAESMVSVLEAFGKDFGIRHWQVDGVEASRISGSRHKPMAYATPGKYLVVATDTALMSRALHTYRADRAHSLGIDPLFRKSYRALDPSGKQQILFAWMNPTELFQPNSAENPSARRLAILASALDSAGSYAAMAPAHLGAPIPGMIAWTTINRQDPNALWRYIVEVRSLGSNPVDSLAHLTGVDIGRQVVPYLGPSMRISYDGIQYLRSVYSEGKTGYGFVAEIPLNGTPPPDFDETIHKIFTAFTSETYLYDSTTSPTVRAWTSVDGSEEDPDDDSEEGSQHESKNDSIARVSRLHPCFALVEGRGLIIAATTTLLHRAIAAPAGTVMAASPGVFDGFVHVDSLAANWLDYVRVVLLRSDLYRPEEIQSRLDPLGKALALYDHFSWSVTVDHGLRHGRGELVAQSNQPTAKR